MNEIEYKMIQQYNGKKFLKNKATNHINVSIHTNTYVYTPLLSDAYICYELNKGKEYWIQHSGKRVAVIFNLFKL